MWWAFKSKVSKFGVDTRVQLEIVRDLPNIVKKLY
jgi:hypothetical protein